MPPSQIRLQIQIIEENNQLRSVYGEAIEKHNSALETDPLPNAGFDLFIPAQATRPIAPGKVAFVGHNIRAVMLEDDRPVAFYLYPRSSISKTGLILANTTGVIDAGYRGEIIGAFRNVSGNVGPYALDTQGFPRLLQICHPSLRSFAVELVDAVAGGQATVRGEGGFGSTGV